MAETAQQRAERLEHEKWARAEIMVAATLTLAVVGPGPHGVDEVIHSFGDLLQRLRRLDVANPPTSDMRRSQE